MPSCSWVSATVPSSRARPRPTSASGLQRAHRHRAVVRVRAEDVVRVAVLRRGRAASSSAVDRHGQGGHGVLMSVSDAESPTALERDRHPGRPVAGLVDGLVDRLVGVVGARAARRCSSASSLAAGVAVEEVPAGCGAPTPRRGRRAARRRPRRRSASVRSTRAGVVERPQHAGHVAPAGSPAASRSASGLAGSPSKSTIFQPLTVRSVWPRWRSPWIALHRRRVGRARRSAS